MQWGDEFSAKMHHCENPISADMWWWKGVQTNVHLELFNLLLKVIINTRNWLKLVQSMKMLWLACCSISCLSPNWHWERRLSYIWQRCTYKPHFLFYPGKKHPLTSQNVFWMRMSLKQNCTQASTGSILFHILALGMVLNNKYKEAL